jgi:hypothetical protein
MSAIFKDIELTWDGQTVLVKPTMALINKLERNRWLSEYAQCAALGDPGYSFLAQALAAIMREGGVEVDADEVFAALVAGEPGEVLAVGNAIIDAIYPSPGKKKAVARLTAARSED